MMGKSAKVSEMIQMPLRQAHDPQVRLSGGVAVFCDPAKYPHHILQTVDVLGFVAAIGVHPKNVISWNAPQKEAFKILMRSPNTKALGEVRQEPLSQVLETANANLRGLFHM
ncbi:hypothetical protein PoB_004302500 [Plakobranchus ocellatus]|uniref:Uncharacterized protein n=1 Tax=Plakobranchus ocellatus TaxID=259542 RepID=A0AAV4BAH4_9GAST|nr:hypothetical protein PoB_004302500 [Plakobranchus ocellatus]